jgi:hypothetical protein
MTDTSKIRENYLYIFAQIFSSPACHHNDEKQDMCHDQNVELSGVLLKLLIAETNRVKIDFVFRVTGPAMPPTSRIPAVELSHVAFPPIYLSRYHD